MGCWGAGTDRPLTQPPKAALPCSLCAWRPWRLCGEFSSLPPNAKTFRICARSAGLFPLVKVNILRYSGRQRPARRGRAQRKTEAQCSRKKFCEKFCEKFGEAFGEEPSDDLATV